MQDLWTAGGKKARSGAKGATAVLGFLTKNIKIVAAVIAVLIVFGLIDSVLTADKIYSGVKIGTVDVGGLTQQQAVDKVHENYGYRMESGHLVIYAGEEGKQKALSGEAEVIDEERTSVEDAAAKTVKWDVYPYDVGTTQPIDTWVEDAFQWGRTEGGPLARVLAQILGKSFDPTLSFDDQLLEELGKKLDATLGETRVDWNIQVVDGVASVTEGKDGFMVDRDKLKDALQDAFMESTDGSGEFIAKAEKAPIRINEKQAKTVCATVNAAIENGATISYEGFCWGIDRAEFGAWVSTSIVKDGMGYSLIPTIKGERARSTMLSTIRNEDDRPTITVSFEVKDGKAYVRPSKKGIIPNVTKGESDLDASLFGTDGKKTTPGVAAVNLEQTESPEVMTLQEALDYGFVETISTYEISYLTGAGAEAKVHNIHLMASELNNTICKVDGYWSFNDIVGDTTPEKGYQSAGTIVEGEYSESVGGGICAVATTIFNALYEAGLNITERHNHSLYIASYPTGRDAAINYPDLDLCWKNDQSSDILLCMGYSDDTVSATLYGISPRYIVTTEQGAWEEGEKYETIVKEDPELPDNYQYVKTYGEDGSKITIVRTVKNQAGEIVSTRQFVSVYDPENEVIVCGPNTEVKKRQDNPTT